MPRLLSNKPSRLLTAEQNRSIFNLLPPSRAALVTTVAVLFHYNQGQWTKKNMGVMCIERDLASKEYHMRFYDLADKALLLQERIKHTGLQFWVVRDLFFQVTVRGMSVGFEFVDHPAGWEEASDVAKALRGNMKKLKKEAEVRYYQEHPEKQKESRFKRLLHRRDKESKWKYGLASAPPPAQQPGRTATQSDWTTDPSIRIISEQMGFDFDEIFSNKEIRDVLENMIKAAGGAGKFIESARNSGYATHLPSSGSSEPKAEAVSPVVKTVGPQTAAAPPDKVQQPKSQTVAPLEKSGGPRTGRPPPPKDFPKPPKSKKECLNEEIVNFKVTNLRATDVPEDQAPEPATPDEITGSQPTASETSGVTAASPPPAPPFPEWAKPRRASTTQRNAAAKKPQATVAEEGKADSRTAATATPEDGTTASPLEAPETTEETAASPPQAPEFTDGTAISPTASPAATKQSAANPPPTPPNRGNVAASPKQTPQTPRKNAPKPTQTPQTPANAESNPPPETAPAADGADFEKDVNPDSFVHSLNKGYRKINAIRAKKQEEQARRRLEMAAEQAKKAEAGKAKGQMSPASGTPDEVTSDSDDSDDDFLAGSLALRQ